MEAINNILNSFKNNNLGNSARKSSAFWGVMVATFITVYKLPLNDQLQALYVWLLFSMICMGIVTIENVIQLKNGKSTSTTETTTTTSEQKNEA